MKIGVLIKQVPDTETKIKIKGDQSGIETGDIKWVINPYDEFAIEEAIRIKEKNAGSEAVVLSLGPDRVLEAMRTALAMGIDKGVHISDDGLALDSTVTAIVLANVIQKMEFDILLCGKQAIDADNSQVVQMIAERLNIPHVLIVEKLEVDATAKKAIATRRASGREIYDVGLPAIFGCEKGLNTPRFASLPGIMKAKSKPVEKIKGSDLVGDAKPLVQFVRYASPPERSNGKIISGEPAEQVSQLVRLLKEEAKVL